MLALLIGFVPLPPSVNALHAVSAHSGKATVYLRKEVVQWKRDAVTCLYAAWQDVARIQVVRESDAPLYVALTAYMTPAQYARRDSDNLAKVVLDTVLNEFLAIDDVRVTDLHISKRIAPHGLTPCLSVSVYQKEVIEDEITKEVQPDAAVGYGEGLAATSRTAGTTRRQGASMEACNRRPRVANARTSPRRQAS